ncbi:glyoxalase I [Russula dissimulans]|nr:glyoxalase I [Russula dissimulans]
MPRSEETASYRFNHTMLRIKDPNISLPFYTDAPELEFSDFTLYFLAFDHTGGQATDADKKKGRLNREGILELTHNHGTELVEGIPYHSGNTDPRGFGHIAITVDDVQAACARFERLGVPFKKRLSEGKMNFLAFILDPDGYWIEVVRHHLRQCVPFLFGLT